MQGQLTHARDAITVRGLAVDAVVGIYPPERVRPQRLLVDLELVLDTERAAVDEALDRSVDYHATAMQVAFLLEAGRFELLETAAHVIARYLFLPPVEVGQAAVPEAVTVALRKPSALGERGEAWVSIRRTREWAGSYAEETKPFGTVDVIVETKDAGFYRLNVGPGRSIPLHHHRVMEEQELVLSPGLRCLGRSVTPGAVFRWPKGAFHDYENPTDRVCSVLCVDRPRFMESDEVPSEGPRADVAPDLTKAWGP